MPPRKRKPAAPADAAARKRKPAARAICASKALAEGGRGVRFEAAYEHVTMPAFVIRFDGKAYGYMNRCMHVCYELDSGSGVFFDDDGLSLVCSAHGATFDPTNGLCNFGPCKGLSLIALDIEETGGKIYCKGVPEDG